MLDNPRNAAAPLRLVQWLIRHSEVEYAASVTAMKAPTTVVTQPEAHGSDYFSSSVTHDVQTAVVRRTSWSEITEDMDSDQHPNANIAETSGTKHPATPTKQESMHYINGTIDPDIRPSKRPESRRECQCPRALPVRNGLIRCTDYLLRCSHSVYSLDEHLLLSNV